MAGFSADCIPASGYISRSVVHLEPSQELDGGDSGQEMLCLGWSCRRRRQLQVLHAEQKSRPFSPPSTATSFHMDALQGPYRFPGTSRLVSIPSRCRGKREVEWPGRAPGYRHLLGRVNDLRKSACPWLSEAKGGQAFAFF